MAKPDGGVTVIANAAVVVYPGYRTRRSHVMKRIILEMGTGNDLYGEDYTKAACRAVDDALHHSSLTLFRSLGFDYIDMDVRVTIAVQQPKQVNTAVVATKLPRGATMFRLFMGASIYMIMRMIRGRSLPPLQLRPISISMRPNGFRRRQGPGTGPKR